MLALCRVASAEVPGGALDFGVVYTGETWLNVSGGVEEGSVYLDNLDVTLHVDAEQLFGWKGTRIVLYGLYNNGGSLSGELVGDLQVVSNIETGVRATRLYEAWIETPLGDEGSFLFGIFDLNREFDVLDSSMLFINSAHGIGTDFGQTGRNGPSIFPFTSLAMRLAWDWNEATRIRLAVFDGVPADPDDPDATAVDLGDGDGALFVGEIEWSSYDRRVLAGAWRYTGNFNSWPEPTASAATRVDDDNGGLYLRGEWMPGGADSGIGLFGRIGITEGAYNIFEAFAGAGFEWEGPFGARPQDTFGAAIALAKASEDYERAFASDGHETKLEFTYRFPLNERLVLQPDLQYIINPGLKPELDNAWVGGLRFELALMP